jgi:hypothetical protein
MSKTTKRSRISQAPAQPELSPKERWECDHAQWEPMIVRRISWRIEAIREHREKFLAKLADAAIAGELARQISWSENVVQEDFERRAWLGILAHRESGESAAMPRARLFFALRHYSDAYTRDLVGDYHRQNSTGAFHRACDAAERAAKARVLQEISGYIAEHDRIEEEGAKLGGGA